MCYTLKLGDVTRINLTNSKFRIAKYVTSQQGGGGHKIVITCDKDGVPKIMKFVCCNLWMIPHHVRECKFC